MKIGGVTVTPPAIDFIILERPDTPLVIQAQALDSYDEFNALCPPPEPPTKLTKEGRVTDSDEPGYLSLIQNWMEQRAAYMVVKCLAPSQIEWDTVRLSSSKTWKNYEQDLRKAGVTAIEFNRIQQLILDINSLNEEKLTQAREVFRRGRAQA